MWATRKHSGFTIVELLIVVVVIGILAAIVIVAYNGITSSANDAAVKSDLANLAKKLEIEKAEKGKYPFPLTVDVDIHVTKSAYAVRNNLYYCYDSATDTYAVQARSVSNNTFKIVDGVVSDGAGSGGFSGGGTCDILGLTWVTDVNGDYGLRNSGTSWMAWAQ
jgi:prepilin-type N-terminal cleavage/methylation domain-containing protein